MIPSAVFVPAVALQTKFPLSSKISISFAFDRFSVACDRAGTKISTEKTEVLCFLRRPRQCILHVSVQVHWVGIHEWRNKGIWSKGFKIKRSSMREICCSVVTKSELSKTAKLSVFKSVFVSILRVKPNFLAAWICLHQIFNIATPFIRALKCSCVLLFRRYHCFKRCPWTRHLGLILFLQSTFCMQMNLYVFFSVYCLICVLFTVSYPIPAWTHL